MSSTFFKSIDREIIVKIKVIKTKKVRAELKNDEKEDDLQDKKRNSLDIIKKTFGKTNLNFSSLKDKVELNIEKTIEKENEGKPVEPEEDYSDEEEETTQKFLESKKIIFSFFFPNNEKVSEFYMDLEKNTNFNFRMILVMYSLVYFIHALILIRIRDYYPNYDTLVGLRIASAALIIVFQFQKKNLYSNNLAKLALFIVMLFSFWISFYQGFSYTSDFHFMQTFQLIEMSLTFTVVIYFPYF